MVTITSLSLIQICQQYALIYSKHSSRGKARRERNELYDGEYDQGKVTYNGSERLRPKTISSPRRFAPETFHPRSFRPLVISPP